MKTDNMSCVKILFRFYSDILDEETVETVWAVVVDNEKGYYRIDNIPFYIPSIASDDIIFATFDEHEEMLTYKETIEYSGNSTIQIILMDPSKDINQIRSIFKALGCISEGVNESYFSMEVPVGVNYKNIKLKLDELEMQLIIDYAESCLADGHR